jgi:hypothetical protein
MNYLRGFKWVFWREVDVQKEHSSLVDRSWRTKNGWDPLINIVTFRTGAEKEKIPLFKPLKIWFFYEGWTLWVSKLRGKRSRDGTGLSPSQKARAWLDFTT